MDVCIQHQNLLGTHKRKIFSNVLVCREDFYEPLLTNPAQVAVKRPSYRMSINKKEKGCIKKIVRSLNWTWGVLLLKDKHTQRSESPFTVRSASHCNMIFVTNASCRQTRLAFTLQSMGSRCLFSSWDFWLLLQLQTMPANSHLMAKQCWRQEINTSV